MAPPRCNRQQGRPAVRHLGIVVGVGTGDRKPEPAAAPEGPGGRQQRETQALRLSLRHWHRICPGEGPKGPAPALPRLGRGFLPVDGAQHAFRHVADRAVFFDLGEIDMHGGVALARGQPEIDDRMAGDLGVVRQRLGSVAQHARVPALPVAIIVARVLGRQAFMPCIGASADCEVDLVAVFALASRHIGESAGRVEVQRSRRPDERPARGGAPGFGAHCEVMHRRFPLQAAVAAHQIVVEEAQHLGKNVEARLDRVAERRDVGARAVVPRAEQQVLALVRQGQETGDGAVGEAGTVRPAADRIDRYVLANGMGIIVGAEGRRSEVRIIGQAVVGEAELGDEVRHVEVAEMLGHGLSQQRAVGILVDRLRPGEARVAEIGIVREEVASIVIEARS